MEGGKDMMQEAALKYRIKILNLLYEELRLTTNIEEQQDIEELIYENLAKLEETLKNS